MSIGLVLLPTLAAASADSPAGRASEILAGLPEQLGPAAQAAADRAQALVQAASEREKPPQSSALHSNLLARNSLVWAKISRDLVRAQQAEAEAERLEEELSTLQAEIVRSEAAVEQAKARVGRAESELRALEQGRPGTGGRP